jgi:hypothetical protein
MRALWSRQGLPGLSMGASKPAERPVDLEQPLDVTGHQHATNHAPVQDFDDIVLPFSKHRQGTPFRTPELASMDSFEDPSPVSAVSSARLKRLSKVSRASSAKEDMLMDLLSSEAMLEARNFAVYSWAELDTVKKVIGSFFGRCVD